MRLRALGFAKASVRQDVRAAQAALGRVQLVARIIAQARATDVLDARQLAEIIAQGVAVRALDARIHVQVVVKGVQRPARLLADQTVTTNAMGALHALENVKLHALVATDAMDAQAHKRQKIVADGVLAHVSQAAEHVPGVLE